MPNPFHDETRFGAGANYVSLTQDGALSSMLICRLYRDPADAADTYPQDVAFLQFDVHYEIDSLGSETEYGKTE